MTDKCKATCVKCTYLKGCKSNNSALNEKLMCPLKCPEIYTLCDGQIGKGPGGQLDQKTHFKNNVADRLIKTHIWFDILIMVCLLYQKSIKTISNSCLCSHNSSVCEMITDICGF